MGPVVVLTPQSIRSSVTRFLTSPLSEIEKEGQHRGRSPLFNAVGILGLDMRVELNVERTPKRRTRERERERESRVTDERE